MSLCCVYLFCLSVCPGNSAAPTSLSYDIIITSGVKLYGGHFSLTDSTCKLAWTLTVVYLSMSANLSISSRILQIIMRSIQLRTGEFPNLQTYRHNSDLAFALDVKKSSCELSLNFPEPRSDSSLLVPKRKKKERESIQEDLSFSLASFQQAAITWRKSTNGYWWLWNDKWAASREKGHQWHLHRFVCRLVKASDACQYVVLVHYSHETKTGKSPEKKLYQSGGNKISVWKEKFHQCPFLMTWLK